MIRGVRRGASLGAGFLDDYAIPALGLLRLHAVDGDLRWLAASRSIAAAIRERFYDEGAGVFLQAEGRAGPTVLPLRRSESDDGVLRSGSSAATLLFLELGELTGDPAFSEAAARAPRCRAAAREQSALVRVPARHRRSRDHRGARGGDCRRCGRSAHPRARA